MAEVETQKDLDFERKHEEDLRRIRDFRLMDDNFMSKVFEDKPCAEFLLRIILNRDDLKVKEVHGQHDLNNIQVMVFYEQQKETGSVYCRIGIKALLVL